MPTVFFIPRKRLQRLIALALLSAFCLCAGAWEPGRAEAARSANAGRDTRASEKKHKASLEEMAGQMIMTGFRGTGEEPLSEDLTELLVDIRAGRVGGVILFDRDAVTRTAGRNIVSFEQTRRLTARLQAAAPVPLFIAVDQEGGRVRRFREEHGAPATPSHQELGQGRPQATRAEARRLGGVLRSAGVNLNFAPSLDVNISPKSPAIGALGRSFSADPLAVAAHGGAFAKGLAEAGMLYCYKHFPGHGSATHDTHDGLADVSSTWRKTELAPYRILIGRQPPAMIMMGHVVLRQKTGDLPASLSHGAVSGMLRRDLGWKGVVVTDDLQMRAIEGRYSTREAVRLAVLAGVDILLFGNNLTHDPKEGRKIHTILVDLVRAGEIPSKRIEESYKRIMKLKANLRKK